MAILKIITYPDPFLKKKTKPVEDINDDIQKLIEDMADTMYEAPGVGLAAIQVGEDRSIIVFDPEADKENRPYQVLINPEIVSKEGEFLSENEGCLSVPEFRSDVKRAEFTVVTGLDRKGNPVRMEAHGLLSVILQHEIDHLNGILFIERISSLKRGIYKRKVKKQLRENE
ncbi:MAG: peptide deformylase [Deltaproteobacteria bacterium]|nr:MAG: peptide deformylase [Deltaproteobacteria bacterium]